MPPPIHCSGYFNFSLREKLREKFDNPNSGPERAGALSLFLSLFHLETNLPANRLEPIPSELAVLHNLLIRGLPTVPPLAVEKALFKLGFTEDKSDETAFRFELTEKATARLDDFFTAMHIVDNRLKLDREDFPRLEKLGSRFEESVFFDKTQSFGFFRQLFEPQVKFDKILQGQNPLARQVTDFAFQIPYVSKDAKSDKLQGFILEVDGRGWHSSFSQKYLDQQRDTTAENAGWHTQRIAEVRQAVATFDLIAQDDFVSQVGQHFQKPFDEQWLNVLQFTLTPFAIARVQKTIIEAALRGHLSLEKEAWEIVVVERDVPCARMAVETLQEMMTHLFALTPGNNNCPKINLKKVFVSKEFEKAALHLGQDVQVGEYDGTSCDLLIDVSVLRRYGLEKHPAYPGTFAIVRSVRWMYFDRQLAFAPSVKYQPIWGKTDNGSGHEIPETCEYLRFFLQNIFRKKDFREGQLPILNRALQGKTVVGLLPTGGGKSLTYQLAALLQPGVSLVVDPIRSLMKDQVDGLKRNGIDICQLINSRLSGAEKRLAMHDLQSGRVLFSFVSPERLLLEDFRDILKSMANANRGFAYCVIDEAHCVSEWGHDFRTSYLALGRNARQLCKPLSGKGEIPLFCLTATASFDVLADVERELEIDKQDADAVVRAENTVRPEIQYDVIPVEIEIPKAEISFTWNGQQQIARHINGQDIGLANAKKRSLVALLNQIPTTYEELQSGIDEILANAWQTLLDDENKKIWGNKDEMFSNFQTKQNARLYYADYTPEKFFGENGGLIFVPHRQGDMGVSDKFKPQKENGQVVNDANGNPVPIVTTARKGVADSLKEADFLEAIPENADIKGVGKYVGTFMGASDVDEKTGSRIDEDSFRNQDLFLQNRLKLMVATKAFGMGIDKPNIRFTVHFNIPASPESFVQESGRAGRDGKLAVSYVLLNQQKFYGFGSKEIRELARRGKEVPNSLRDKWFEEADFRHVLQVLNLPEDLKKEAADPRVKSKAVRMWQKDLDVLEFFYNNSFKGEEKEKAILHGLLEKITFPQTPDTSKLDVALEKKLGIGIQTIYWEKLEEQKSRIYLKDDNEQDLGNLDLERDWQMWPTAVPQSRTLLEALCQIVQEEFNELPSIPAFKEHLQKKDRPGILTRLEEVEEAIAFKVEIHFSNHLFTLEAHAHEIWEFVRYHILPEVIEKRVFDMLKNAEDKRYSFEDFCETISDDRQRARFQANFKSLSPDREAEFRQLYHARRDKSDTDKAIYRLTSIGIVDDFTVDYHTKMYHLTIHKKPLEQYVLNLYNFICRYYSEQRAKQEIQKLGFVRLADAEQPVSGKDNLQLSTSDLGTVLRGCLDFLVDFTYREIAEKRRLAIGDMFDACNEYFTKSGGQANGNFAMKEFLYLYFNSKYARQGYEAKLENEDESPACSLLNETERGREELSFERILDYIRVMSKDKSGSEIDNTKHLRGASVRLLRDQPKNASLKLLKAFTLFTLGQNNPTMIQEAEEACFGGFETLVQNGETEGGIRQKVEQYANEVLHHIPQVLRKPVGDFLKHLPDTLFLKYHSEWLEGFNSKFLKNLYA